MDRRAVAASDLRREHIEVRGAVQGVGFRPFVYRLAHEEGLAGWVVNDVEGVVIEVEGPADRLSSFRTRLGAETPRLAKLGSVVAEPCEPLGEGGFVIRPSEAGGHKTAPILPDVATCDDCAAEIDDPADRRHRYPFTNCTNCGPRFSIIGDLPYDRPNTTMRDFTMCAACRAEYDDPGDRRFHAQPNACPQCGPHVSIATRRASDRHEGGDGPAALVAAAEALRAGSVVAVKGLGGFHLMADAADESAVRSLRDRKPRPHKPLAVMVRDLDQARRIAHVGDAEAGLLRSAESPIVLLRRRDDAPVCEAVAPGNPTLGVMLAYTPLHRLLLDEVGRPIVATSGNVTDEPIAIDAGSAMERLGHVADVFLVHDRPIERHADDSVAWVVDGQPQLLRRARGYAPAPVRLSVPGPTVLALGAHLKSTVALRSGRQVFVSQHIGDLATPEALDAFERVIADFLRMYDAQPDVVVHDLHPDYLSTRWARESEWSDRLVAAQHHHAHLAACLADNDHPGPALGVTWDGTGLGPDGTVWGGEFLLGDAGSVERVAHLRPFRLPGGDRAVHEPRRVAAALLWEMYGDAAMAMDVPPVVALTDAERRLLVQMLEQDVNAPVTTSAGRLFDGMAALLGLRQRVTFEGHAAMDLEFVADPAERGTYPCPIGDEDDNRLVLDWQPMIAAALDDVAAGATPGTVAARFHQTLADAIVAVARTVAMPTVALTGGCFQNRLLTERTARALRAAGLEVLLHREIPPNDGGISMGQVAIAAARRAGG